MDFAKSPFDVHGIYKTTDNPIMKNSASVLICLFLTASLIGLSTTKADDEIKQQILKLFPQADTDKDGFFWKQGGADGTRKVIAYEYYDTFKQQVSDLHTLCGGRVLQRQIDAPAASAQ